MLANPAPAANSAGYLGAPPNEQDASYTFVITDAGKMVRANDGSAVTYTIPPNSGVAFPVGTIIGVGNIGGGVITLTRGAGVTQYLAGAGTSKDVAMAQWALGSARGCIWAIRRCISWRRRCGLAAFIHFTAPWHGRIAILQSSVRRCTAFRRWGLLLCC